MDGDFLSYVEQASIDFLNTVQELKKPVKIIGNIDADGITSSSILAKALIRKEINYSLSVVKQVNSELIESLKNEDAGIIIFADVGSNHVNEISEELDCDVFILDHHISKVDNKKHEKVRQVNPQLFGIDGTKEISSSGVCYFFARALDVQNEDLSYLALVGAIGDMQEDMGFKGLNKIILEDALKRDLIEIKNSLRIFGMQTKPLYKVLENSTNPYIPGVTGNQRAAIKFVEDTGIELYDKTKNFRKLVNLTKEELEKLMTAINLKKTNQSNEILIGPVFLLKHEEEDSMKKDLREFSTLLNSCGRTGWPSLGIGVCMNDSNATKRAYDIMRGYQKEVIDALNWFYEHRRSEKVIEKDNYVMILAESNIRDTIIGTLASLLSKSNVYPDGTVILSSAYTLDGFIKISLRISGKPSENIDLRQIVEKILVDTEGYGGGHKFASGASIPQEKEDQIIRNAITALDNAFETSSVSLEQ